MKAFQWVLSFDVYAEKNKTHKSFDSFKVFSRSKVEYGTHEEF